MATEDFATWERNRIRAYDKHADEMKVMVAKHDEKQTLFRDLVRIEKLRRNILADDSKPPEIYEEGYEERVHNYQYKLDVIDMTIKFYRSRIDE